MADLRESILLNISDRQATKQHGYKQVLSALYRTIARHEHVSSDSCHECKFSWPCPAVRIVAKELGIKEQV